LNYLIILLLVVLLAGFALTTNQSPSNGSITQVATGSFHDLSVAGIAGDSLRMSDYKGKYVLCVNVASQCGYTPQYKGLQSLYTTYGDKLVVIGFPCNQFMGQEPGSEEEIKAFCEMEFGVTFPMTEKINVKGPQQHPIYQWLCHQPLDGKASHEVTWNFHKFLVSPEGRLVGHFGKKVDPMDDEITRLIR
jgi:glutathione peroxidase